MGCGRFSAPLLGMATCTAPKGPNCAGRGGTELLILHLPRGVPTAYPALWPHAGLDNAPHTHILVRGCSNVRQFCLCTVPQPIWP